MKSKKTKIDELEEVFLLAYEMELIESVSIRKDYITIKLVETADAVTTLNKLAEHIKKNYPQVKHFHIRRAAREIQIYHYRWLEHTMRLVKEENTP
jgi:hypothetical protein